MVRALAHLEKAGVEGRPAGANDLERKAECFSSASRGWQLLDLAYLETQSNSFSFCPKHCIH